MLEILFCSMLTILPDFLYRRFVQGKRIGREITLFSVWYELRYGITACLALAVLMITVIFYSHPSSKAATLYFRTVPILPEIGGRVAEVYVDGRGRVEAGQPLFRLDTTQQEAAATTARSRLAEIDAQSRMAAAEVAAADGQVAQARGALRQVEDELRTKTEIASRNASAVPAREIERLQVSVQEAEGALAAAVASREAARTQLEVLLPAQRASAQAQLAEAEVAVSKGTVVAGVPGMLEQFTLRVGDVVNPMLRPAGILIADSDRTRRIAAGFGQVEAQVIRPGMYAEIACPSMPLRVIPMVVVGVQDALTTGQVRVSDQLIDVAQIARTPGTVLAFMEPLYEGGLDDLPLGAVCMANAYTSNHDRIASGEVTGLHALGLHAVDALGAVHAIILRAQTLMTPIRLLVLTGGGGH
jgi:multidrug resistance efflux pump